MDTPARHGVYLVVVLLLTFELPTCVHSQDCGSLTDPPTCEDCGNLTDPANGQVNHNDGTTFGHTATYSCNTGYKLVGNSTRTCQATGQWSGSAPTCQDCGSLTDPANGQVNHNDGTTFGHTATYSCNTGYNLVGDSTRTCQATGVWSGSAPTCQAVDCRNLTDPANGQVNHTSGTTFGQTATYSCNTGYNLVGDSTRTCQATGQWSGSVPTCEDCGSLTDPANGQVNHNDGTTFGQTATYSCNTGYTLVGNSTRTCQATRQWSGSAPTCQAVDCGSLTDPANGQVNHNDGTTFGQTATYSCNTGYNLMGDSTHTCQATGQWSGSAPTCQAVDCDDLTDPANGSVAHTAGKTFGQTATYSCNTGYNLVGNSTRTCQATGQWSGSAPTCQASIPTTSQTVGVSSPIQSSGTITTTGTAPVSSSKQPTGNPPSDGATGTDSASSSTQPSITPPSDGATGTVPVSSSTQPSITPPSDGASGTVPVSSSTQPTNNPPSDGTTTTSVIIVVAVVIILVVIVVGVIILVVLFRAKKRKQKLVINKLQNVPTQNQDIEMKLKQEGTTEIEVKSSADQPQYAEIQKKAPPNVPSKSEELVEYLSKNTIVTGGYNVVELERDDCEYALHTEPEAPSLSEPLSDKMEPNPMYQSMDQHSSTPNMPQEADIYYVPDITSSRTVESKSELYEPVYSEPIKPSLFTGAVGSPSDSEDLQPYAPIYTLPNNLPGTKEGPLKIFGSNIQEIRELGKGLFGKVILAETVGLSPKDLRLSESDDDKSKSTLVAVKKLKSGAPNATKEAFEKEVNFMSRLTNRNVIRILGVCYENTPFIMMEYMEKGDLNQYLQKFEIHTTDSESQGQITTKILVHMTTQIASAMKYLTSHNFVHRDLATRNCLVGPNYLVKISDFGMSRSLYDSHYYRIQGQFALPVRWMSIECFYGKFSQKSDVWAFGITMWEIFTLAKEQPYNDMSDKQVIEDALKGKNRKILARPYMCPVEVYIIMLKCWAHNSEQRATFEELFQQLTSI